MGNGIGQAKTNVKEYIMGQLFYRDEAAAAVTVRGLGGWR